MKYPRITLKAARVNAGHSQREAAKLLGISPATLQNYEAGATVPDWDMVKKIETTYNFPSDYIFFGHNYALSVEKETCNTRDTP
jgi:transcriptional regulator with XRE-family HTH domain